MITNDQQIISDTDIVDLISAFIDIKKRGANHVGPCPFHDEKTPSFTVNQSNNRYKCFGCGRGGDAANFLMDHEDMDYPEALEYLASFNGIEVEYKKGKHVDKWNQAKVAAKAKREAYKPIIAAVWDYFRSYSTKLEINDTDPENVLIDFMGRSWKKDRLKDLLSTQKKRIYQ